jgi:hypothetical protein
VPRNVIDDTAIDTFGGDARLEMFAIILALLLALLIATWR